MNRQQRQGKAESSEGQMGCAERLDLLQLQRCDQGLRRVGLRPGNLSNGGSVQGQVEVGAGLKLGKVV